MAGSQLLADVPAVMHRQHDSIHTERSYCDWIARSVNFHRMRSRQESLAAGALEVEAFLSDLAVDGKVAASTQNQAMNALVFLYKRVLERPLEGRVNAKKDGAGVAIKHLGDWRSTSPPHSQSPRTGAPQG